MESNMASLLVLVLVLVLVAVDAAGEPRSALCLAPNRLTDSPYPFSCQPHRLYAFNSTGSGNLPTQGCSLTVQSLQGLASRFANEVHHEGIYVLTDPNSAYPVWLRNLASRFSVEVNATFSADFVGLVTHFIRKFGASSDAPLAGYLLCNASDGDSVQASVSLSSVLRAVIAPSDSPETIQLLESLGLSLLLNLTHSNSTWVFQNFWNSSSTKNNFNSRLLVYQDPSKTAYLMDYAVFGRSFALYDDNIGDPIVSDVLNSLQPQTAVVGWGPSELFFVALLSSRAAFIHAADWAQNLSVLTNFFVSAFAQKSRSVNQMLASSLASLENSVQDGHSQRKSDVGGVGEDDQKHTVTFVFTDGDNVQWVLSDFLTSPNWFGSPSRGKVPVGWTLSPALSELAPSVMSYLYEQASSSDVFIGAPSGLGYAYPNAYESADLAGFGSLTAAYLNRSDMSVLNILGENNGTQYLIPFMSHSEISGVFYYSYDDYSGLNGSISWYNCTTGTISPSTSSSSSFSEETAIATTNSSRLQRMAMEAPFHSVSLHQRPPTGNKNADESEIDDSCPHGSKPVIGGRFNLWQGFNTPQSLAAKLNSQVRDGTTPLGYSLIPVHVWSMTYDDVVECVSLLDAAGVQVVDPNTFVALITEKVFR